MTIDPRPQRERASTHLESLPLPFAHYGGLYSTFVLFSETETSQQYLCECSRKAVENHLVGFWSARGDKPPWTIRQIPGFAKAADPGVEAQSAELNLPTDVLPHLRFAEGIFHRCNLAVPSIDYGYEICYKRTTFFAQRFGFYITQWLHSQGLGDWGWTLPNVPVGEEIRHLITVDEPAARKLFSACWKARSSGEPPPLTHEEERELRAGPKATASLDLWLCRTSSTNLLPFPPRGKLAQAEHLLTLLAARIFLS